jgi:hypothetical protein
MSLEPNCRLMGRLRRLNQGPLRKRGYAYPLVLFPFVALAADFRALDVGQSCGTVQAWELAHGSIQIPSHSDSGLEVYAFSAEDFGRHIELTYVCVNGALRDGSWRFPNESWQQAVESYRSLYVSLAATYGAAALQGHPWDETSDQKVIADHWFKLTSMWVKSGGNAIVTLNIQPTPPFMPESPKWSIGITVSKAHIKTEPKIGSNNVRF